MFEELAPNEVQGHPMSTQNRNFPQTVLSWAWHGARMGRSAGVGFIPTSWAIGFWALTPPEVPWITEFAWGAMENSNFLGYRVIPGQIIVWEPEFPGYSEIASKVSFIGFMVDDTEVMLDETSVFPLEVDLGYGAINSWLQLIQVVFNVD